MRITFLVGNGFDINLGAKTSYSDFYEWFLSDDRDTAIGTVEIRKMKDSIRKDKDNGRDNWSDLEIGLGRFTEEFSTGEEDSFIECYTEISDRMIDYVRAEEERLSYDNFDDDSLNKSLCELGKFHSGLLGREKSLFDDIIRDSKNEEAEIEFLSFNYTNLLDKYVSEIGARSQTIQIDEDAMLRLKVNQSVIHVNGTLDIFPILGVDNETQLNNQEFWHNNSIREIMIKQEGKDSVGADDYSNALNAINESDIICIYGMSLGDCDKTWWSAIIEWLNNGIFHQLMIYWYSDPPVIKRIRPYNDSIRRVKEKFLRHSMYSDEENAELIDRIHVVFNSEIFNVKFRPRAIA